MNSLNATPKQDDAHEVRRLMTNKRNYDDGCGMAHALELIGERWAILIIRELLMGPRRFTDLRAGLPTISPNVLTQRLEELERSSIVVRRKLAPPGVAWVYELTNWGHELEPVLLALGCWALRSPTFPEKRSISANSFALGLRSMFHPAAAGELEAAIELHVDDQTFRATIRSGKIEVETGAADQPDVVVTGNPNVLVAVMHRGQSLAKALRDGELRLEGDEGKLRAFFGAFRAPAPAVPTFPAAPRLSGRRLPRKVPSGSRTKQARRQM